MMNSKSIEIDLGVLESDEWIKVNKDNIGFYLTFYSSEMFENLLLNLSDPNNYASPLDRFGVVNEAFFAVRLIEWMNNVIFFLIRELYSVLVR